MPVEIPDPIRFEDDVVHHAYDPAAANTFWRVLLAIEPVFDEFRGGFIGKSSPVHFFWGSFDLALTRFSGRRAPERKDGGSIMREAYSHEAISHGFWPGSGPVQEPAFYAYAAPEPEGLKTAAIEPQPSPGGTARHSSAADEDPPMGRRAGHELGRWAKEVRVISIACWGLHGPPL
jgi:hypothetical protein